MDNKKWLSTREAAEILGKTPTRARQYTYEDRWGLDVKPREAGERIWISEESVYRLKRELEENTAGRPKVKMAPKALRNLQYAKNAIEAIPLASKYKEPIIALIGKFLEPELEEWRATQEEPSEPTSSEPKNSESSSVRILDFTGEE